MVYNCFIKCQVCGSITRVRLQVGWQEQHPIVIACGKCSTSLMGKVHIGQDKPVLEFDFDNAQILSNDDRADYVVECSGEFPTIKPYDGIQSEGVDITPFIRNQMRMKGEDGYEKFAKSISALNKTAKKWTDYKRVLDLSQNDNKRYLIQEIKKIFPENIYPCRNEFEILRAIHMVEVHGFISPLRRDIIDNLTISGSVLNLDIKQISALIKYLNAQDGYNLNELQLLIYKMLNEFIGVFPFLIPAFATQFYKENSMDYEIEGSTTSTFDLVKQFYLDAYEALGNLMVLPLALNNIKYRGNYNSVNSLVKKVNSLDDFLGLTKANRYHFCDETEMYTRCLHVLFNSKLRNAIGHNDVNYNTITQQITYIPNPKDRTKKETTYLLQFENEAVHLFQALLVISEYLYRIREIDLMIKGIVPIKPDIPIKKSKEIGRNEPCPCGSGKKFKKCCIGKDIFD